MLARRVRLDAAHSLLVPARDMNVGVCSSLRMLCVTAALKCTRAAVFVLVLVLASAQIKRRLL